MRRSVAMALFVGVFTLAVISPAAIDRAVGEDKIRILLTSGGHGFEEQPFYAMFDAMKDIEYTKAKMPDDAGMLKPGLEKKFDCIVMYDMCRPAIKPEQQEAFRALLNTGIGLVSMHHNLGAHDGWDDFRKIIGGQFILSDRKIDGKAYKTTPWAHDKDLNIKVIVKDHPITRGVEDFTIHDETYGLFHMEPGIKPLMITDHPENNREVAWVHKYGKSRVFHLMLGHDGKAYANPDFRKVLNQGIRWAAGKE
jgi:uncharacterized protein